MTNSDELQMETANPAQTDDKPSGPDQTSREGETALKERGAEARKESSDDRPANPEKASRTGTETETPEPRNQNPSGQTKPLFIIRRKPDSGETIVRDVSPEFLLERYPMLKTQRGLAQTNRPLLVITEEAERIIKKHIAWGKETARNVCEQGGLLIGKPVRVNQRRVGLAESAIPAELTRSDAAYLEMGVDTWAKMLNVFDERYSGQGLYVIGWYHTHPNGLPVFMSGTDLRTQRAFFNQPWHFAAVLNPHRKLLACFHSAQAEKCDYCPKTFTD